MKVKKGDKVKVIAGKFKGTIGEVLAVFPKRERVTVDSVNVKKRTLKKTDSSNSENFIYIQHPIHLSNVVKFEGEVEIKSEKKEKVAKKSATKKTTKIKSVSSSK